MDLAIEWTKFQDPPNRFRFGNSIPQVLSPRIFLEALQLLILKFLSPKPDWIGRGRFLQGEAERSLFVKLPGVGGLACRIEGRGRQKVEDPSR